MRYPTASMRRKRLAAAGIRTQEFPHDDLRLTPPVQQFLQKELGVKPGESVVFRITAFPVDGQ